MSPERDEAPRFWTTSSLGVPGLDGIWRHQPASEDRAPERHFVPPDACADLIVHFSGDHLLGVTLQEPTMRAEVVSIPAHAALFGVRFQRGVGGALLRQRAELERATATLFAREDARDITAVSERLAAFAAELVQQHAGGTPEWLAEALREAERRAGNVSVAELSKHVGVTERSLHRGFTAWVGVGPKPLLRVLRVRRAAGLLESASSLADVAAEVGFADQAHLSREMRELWGATPLSLRTSDLFKTGAATGL